MTTVFSTKMWDVSQMPRKLYMHTGNGILKAIRPKFFVMVKCNQEHIEGTHEIFGFEMAGEDGIQTVRVNTYNGPSILFASPEDFDYWRTTGRASYQIPTCGATDILRANEYVWDGIGVRLWYNKLGTPSYRSGFGFRVWTDRDGLHADHEPFHQSYENLYKTREECVTNLPTVVVSDFDDDEPEEKKPVKRLDHDSALICESIQEVTLICWPMIYGENNDHDLDSREVLDLFRTWGEEFESWWINHPEEWICEHDYIAEVEHFAEQKAAAYLESLK